MNTKAAITRWAILSAVAMLAMTGCKEKSKTNKKATMPDKDQVKAMVSEARVSLRAISTAAETYFETKHMKRDGTPIPNQFPDTVGLTPPTPCCKQPDHVCKGGDWTDPTWMTMKFSIADPHYFQYEFASCGSGKNAKYVARAVADPLCNGKYLVVETRRSGKSLGSSAAHGPAPIKVSTVTSVPKLHLECK
ncbi:MAG: hypothetical protein J7M25_08665 [Deltaproteobacteria bacterium]|nr:hypothetical protein [Deltaproteobacteria bacterium]